MNKEEMQNKINELKANIEELENELKNMDSSKGWKPIKNKICYFVSSFACGSYTYEKDEFDKELTDIGNYFKTKEEAERVQFEQNLRLKLRKFAQDNNDLIDWNNNKQAKYHIYYDYIIRELSLSSYFTCEDFGRIYFSSKKLAEEAIELFYDDLIKYFEEE